MHCQLNQGAQHEVYTCRDQQASVSLEGFSQVTPQVVTWEGISCQVPQGHTRRPRQILHSISGVAAVIGEDGQLSPCLFAVLGPSGAGKTTFMDILSGRKRDKGGLVFCMSCIIAFTLKPQEFALLLHGDKCKI